MLLSRFKVSLGTHIEGGLGGAERWLNLLEKSIAALSCHTCKDTLHSIATACFNMPTFLTSFRYTIPALGDLRRTQVSRGAHGVDVTCSKQGHATYVPAGSSHSNQSREGNKEIKKRASFGKRLLKTLNK